jgi:hypothetical protein
MSHPRIKASQAVQVREALLKQQGYRCPLCHGSLTARSKKAPALDHDHQTGFIRDVLCINCNGIEGKVFNLVRRAKAELTPLAWLENFIAYHQRHMTPQHGGIYHHTHKTAEEKRLATNAKARSRRAAAKAAAT